MNIEIEIEDSEGIITSPEKMYVEPKTGLVAPETKWREIVKDFGDRHIIQCVIEDGTWMAVGRDTREYIVLTNEGSSIWRPSTSTAAAIPSLDEDDEEDDDDGAAD